MARLNIHLALDEQTVAFCRWVNANIRGIAKSAIVFSEKSPMIPHITLVMGDFVPSQNFEALTRATEMLAQKVRPLTLKLGQPYIDLLTGRFVLCDIEEHPALTELRKMMRETLLGKYLTTPYANPREPHITLAHIYTCQEKVESYLQSIHELPSVVCSEIEISHVGPRGACVSRLFDLDLTHQRERRVPVRRNQLSLGGVAYATLPQ